MIHKGEHFIHDLTGRPVKVVGRGHYPDTIFVEFEDDGRKVEVYIRHLTKRG